MRPENIGRGITCAFEFPAVDEPKLAHPHELVFPESSSKLAQNRLIGRNAIRKEQQNAEQNHNPPYPLASRGGMKPFPDRKRTRMIFDLEIRRLKAQHPTLDRAAAFLQACENLNFYPRSAPRWCAAAGDCPFHKNSGATVDGTCWSCCAESLEPAIQGWEAARLAS